MGTEMREDQQLLPNSGGWVCVGGVKQQLQLWAEGTLTSLQEEPDVVCVVDLHSVAAGQSVQQRCLPYEVEGG